MNERPWPQMMKLATAAAYLDMVPATFSREVAAGRLPKPVEFGGSAHWHKPAIDDAIDALVGNTRSARNESWSYYDPPPRRSSEPTRAEDSDRPFSVKALAERWTCSEGLVRNLIKDGRLAAFRHGKLIRITSKEVARFERVPE